MKINKLEIKEDKFDVNLVFYNFLKKITQAKFTDNQINSILAIYFSNSKKDVEIIKDLIWNYFDEEIKRGDKSLLYTSIEDVDVATIDIFVFALKLNLIKDLLLQEAKIAQTLKAQKLQNLDQLSLAYDKISTQVAYATRISGALLSLLFHYLQQYFRLRRLFQIVLGGFYRDQIQVSVSDKKLVCQAV